MNFWWMAEEWFLAWNTRYTLYDYYDTFLFRGFSIKYCVFSSAKLPNDRPKTSILVPLSAYKDSNDGHVLNKFYKAKE